MLTRVNSKFALMLCTVLTAVAGLSVSTICAFLWHEPDCPEELLK